MRFFAGKPKKNRGFSLIEVLLVLILLVAVFFPLIQILSRTLIASGEAKNTNTALKIAQTKLEQIKNSSYSSISSEAKSTVSAFPAFQEQVIVTEPNTGLKNIRVIVYWVASEGSEISVEVESITSNN